MSMKHIICVLLILMLSTVAFASEPKQRGTSFIIGNEIFIINSYNINDDTYNIQTSSSSNVLTYPRTVVDEWISIPPESTSESVWRSFIGSLSRGTITSTKGDFNNDGIVDYKDISIFGATWGSGVGNKEYNPIADLNSDGIIDYKDLSILGTLVNNNPSTPSSAPTPPTAPASPAPVTGISSTNKVESSSSIETVTFRVVFGSGSSTPNIDLRLDDSTYISAVRTPNSAMSIDIPLKKRTNPYKLCAEVLCSTYTTGIPYETSILQTPYPTSTPNPTSTPYTSNSAQTLQLNGVTWTRIPTSLLFTMENTVDIVGTEMHMKTTDRAHWVGAYTFAPVGDRIRVIEFKARIDTGHIIVLPMYMDSSNFYAVSYNHNDIVVSYNYNEVLGTANLLTSDSGIHSWKITLSNDKISVYFDNALKLDSIPMKKGLNDGFVGFAKGDFDGDVYYSDIKIYSQSPTPTPTPTITNTYISPTPVIIGTPILVKETPMGTPILAKETSKPTQKSPGFEIIITIGMLLLTIKRRKGESHEK